MKLRIVHAFIGFVFACLLTASAYAGDSGGAFVTGWNLSGNSTANPYDVSTLFGTSAAPVSGVTGNVVAVWKWDAAGRTWQMYTPALSSSALAAFAAKHRLAVLTTINGGEGYWVNASSPFSLPPAAATDGTYTLTGADLARGWNMVITGENVAPKDLNTALQGTFANLPPAPGGSAGTAQQGFVSLWAWDNNSKNWYFYAPSLDRNGMLARFVSRSGLLDFTAAGKVLGPGVGFWLNMP